MTFTLTPRDLASFDEASSSWLAEAGTYTVKIGASSQDIRQTATFQTTREEKVATVSAASASHGEVIMWRMSMGLVVGLGVLLAAGPPVAGRQAAGAVAGPRGTSTRSPPDSASSS